MRAGAAPHDGPAREQQHVVEEAHDLRRRLVDAHHHDAAGARHGVQQHDEPGGEVGVQPGGGLVEEQHARVRHQLHGDAEPAPLATRDASARHAAHERARHAGEPELVDHVLHARHAPPARRVPGHAQPAGVHHGLAHREVRQEEVVLGHVGDPPAVEASAGLPVQQHAATHGGTGPDGVAREHVEEGRLAGARGPQDGAQLVAHYRAAHGVEQLAGLRLRLCLAAGGALPPERRDPAPLRLRLQLHGQAVEGEARGVCRRIVAEARSCRATLPPCLNAVPRGG
mmetsp:Transcript_6253/g.21978  ORF Transcript_6253/g.21978 Transcript_6253/m.21978 type:complete len:284 (-) Transcript_6253:40-891(-)